MLNLYRAFFPRTRGHVLLGRRVLPLSNWHLLQLQLAESPLVKGEAAADLAGFAATVAICCSRFPDRFTPPVGWRENFLYRLALRAAAADVDRFHLELVAWRQYRADYDALPETFRRQSARACACPAPLAVWASLFLAGFSEADAWNQPLGRAGWYKIALAEAQGAEINLVTDEARAAMIKAGWGHLLREGA